MARTGLAVNDIYNDGSKPARYDKARAIIGKLGGSNRSGGSSMGGDLMNRLK